MKRILLTNFIIGVCVLYLWPSARSQYFEDPTIYYKPMQFDLLLRGQYNTTKCMSDLLECWEHMRADVICDHKRMDFETYCAVNKKYCHIMFDDFDSYRHRFIAYTGFCEKYKPWSQIGYNQYWGSPRGNYTKK